ncbi:uncharacterized protein K452DRAFT_337319 [Aplosporella prunicola CBS 121167]|uniref:Uncharacterized protein n=1 Tax=Aplosporella prunicola CBS 121167 TaxID=1176127 RepID=A0A6A6BVT8_9PEZI|nr:uncharacterized protein K452DRAFT_337319 [Aplosporella prunicola CBS 121167]KAF2146977.1 hypothetical protein K452DRAFT_337319 [Aplosporella prunicola CBS 121167]
MSIATPKVHGVKRSAAEALENDQRLAKRFDLLNIDSNGKLYIPVAASSRAPPPTLEPQEAPPPRPADGGGDDDWMQLEDTKDKIYIYDLDKELAEIESDEDKPVFLPDIEKHLARIPKHLLVGQDLQQTRDNQLVLYKVPSSLTVPEDKDSVRKAIIEARARASENHQAPGDGDAATSATNATNDDFMAVEGEDTMDDVDKMDMD